MAKTLAELKLAARRRANFENTTFVKEDELRDFVNGSYAELYDLLVSRFEDYYMTKTSVTVASPAVSFPLPTDCYKVRGVDFKNSASDFVTVRQWSFEDRNKLSKAFSRQLYGVNDRNFRVMGQTVYILPDDKAAGDYQVWYVPRFVPLDSDSDELSDVLDFDEYIILDVCIKLCLKEETDPQPFMILKEAMKQRVLAMASNRSTEPERIQDTSINNLYDSIFPRG